MAPYLTLPLIRTLVPAFPRPLTHTHTHMHTHMHMHTHIAISLPCLSTHIAPLPVLQTGQNSSQGQADERMMQLLRLLNRPLERSPESRRRNLAWYTPIIVPVWPQVGVFMWGGDASEGGGCRVGRGGVLCLFHACLLQHPALTPHPNTHQVSVASAFSLAPTPSHPHTRPHYLALSYTHSPTHSLTPNPHPRTPSPPTQVRLFEEHPSTCSYNEAYEINCARFGREPDMPIVHFKKRLAQADGQYQQVGVGVVWCGVGWREGGAGEGPRGRKLTAYQSTARHTYSTGGTAWMSGSQWL